MDDSPAANHLIAYPCTSHWLGLTFLLVLSSAGMADNSGIVVRGAWIPEAPPGAPMLAGYAQIENQGVRQCSLTGASSTAFGSVEVHATVIEDGVASMHHVPILQIKPAQKVLLQPGGIHLMLMRPARAPHAGDSIQMQLDFGVCGVQTVPFQVRAR